MLLPIFVVDTKIIYRYDFVKSILSQSANAEPKGRYSITLFRRISQCFKRYLRSRCRKWDHFCIYHFYFQNYGYLNQKNDSFFVFSANDSKKSVTVWAQYLSASERSSLDLF